MHSIGRDKNTISTAFIVKGCDKWKAGAYMRWQALDTDFCRIRKETRKCSIYLHRNWVFTDVLLFLVMTLICILPLHFYKTCVWKYVSGRNFMWGKKEIEFSWPPLLCCSSLWPWPCHWLRQSNLVLEFVVPPAWNTSQFGLSMKDWNRKGSFTFNCGKKQTCNC